MKLGSHNTMSYLKPQWYLMPIHWILKCQSRDIVDQFDYGARWFDLSLSFTKSGKPYFSNGIFKYHGVDVLDTLETLNSKSNPVDKVYIRLLNERDTERDKNFFKEFCSENLHKFKNLIFCGGRNKSDWESLYKLETTLDMPLVDRYSSCCCGVTLYNENGEKVKINPTEAFFSCIFPRIYSKKYNLKYRIDYINYSIYLVQDFIGKY